MRISDWSSDVCSSDLGIARDKQLRDAVIEAILDNLSGTLPRDSRVITIAFTSPDPALAARIANTYTSEFIKSNLQRKFNSTSYARDFLSQQLGEAKAKLEQSERDLNTYAREVGLIKTEQTNPDGSTSTGVGSVTTASLVQLNQATNEATASRVAAEDKWRAIERKHVTSNHD